MRLERYLLIEATITYQTVDFEWIAKHEKYNFKKIFDRIKYFRGDHNEYSGPLEKLRHYIVAMSGSKIIGVLKLATNNGSAKEDERGMYFVSVDPSYRNMGVGSTLLRKMFEFARSKGFSIHLSSYTKEGRVYAAPVVEKLKKEFSDVKVFDSPYGDF